MTIFLKSVIKFLLMKKVSEKISEAIEIKNEKIPKKQKISKKKVTSLMLILTSLIYAASINGIISEDFAKTINAIILNNPELTQEIVESFE